MKYKIGVTWEMYGEMEIEADTLEQAIEIANMSGMPYNGEYIDDSFRVDVDGIEFLNNPIEIDE